MCKKQNIYKSFLLVVLWLSLLIFVSFPSVSDYYSRRTHYRRGEGEEEKKIFFSFFPSLPLSALPAEEEKEVQSFSLCSKMKLVSENWFNVMHLSTQMYCNDDRIKQSICQSNLVLPSSRYSKIFRLLSNDVYDITKKENGRNVRQSILSP